MAKDKTFKTTIIVDGSEITVTSTGEANKDYISLTDMTKNFEGGSALIEQWLRNKDTILFMGTWEKLYNADFNSLEFEGIKNEAGASSYYLSVKKWVLPEQLKNTNFKLVEFDQFKNQAGSNAKQLANLNPSKKILKDGESNEA